MSDKMREALEQLDRGEKVLTLLEAGLDYTFQKEMVSEILGALVSVRAVFRASPEERPQEPAREEELALIDAAFVMAMDGLECDSDLDFRRRAFERIQDLYEPERLMGQYRNRVDPMEPQEPERPQDEKRLPPRHGFIGDESQERCGWYPGGDAPVCGQPRSAHLPPHESE
jgi:hypothetical protein